MQNSFYASGTSNHDEHNKNDDYWNILLNNNEKFEGKLALDFGCGKGRNINNIKNLFDFFRVDGVDISQANINHCKSTIENSVFIKNNGVDLSKIESEKYDFVISTIVLQHIPVHQIRYNLMSEMFRVMKSAGELRFQMGYGKDLKHYNGGLDRKGYFENYYDADGTNGILDVRVTNENDLISDLKKIGFREIEVQIRDSFSDTGHPQWIYVKCKK